MIDHPFMDFKNLSDDDLSNKESQIMKNLYRARMWGSSPELINQLNWTLEMINEERVERLQRQQFDLTQEMFPKIIDSDPEFKKDHAEIDEIKTTVVKPAAKKPMSSEAPIFHKEYLRDSGDKTPE